jgi:hypothetical protein
MAGFATAAAFGTLGVGLAHEGGNHSEDPAVPSGHHRVQRGIETTIPEKLTIHVGKNDTADEIGDKFTDNYTDLKEVSADVVSAEPNPPVLNSGDSLQVSTEHMDPQAVEEYMDHSQNSAGH